MSLLLDAYALALAAAAALGLVVGFAGGPGEGSSPGNRRAGPAWPIALALAGLAAAAAAGPFVPGRAGLWLETGLLMTLAYLAGCAAGCIARRLAGGAGPG